MGNKQYTPVPSSKDKQELLAVLELAEMRKDIKELKKDQQELKKDQQNTLIKFVELLGIFAAMLSFIVVFIDLSTSLGKISSSEIAALMILMGAILVFFVLILNWVIKK